MATKFARRVKEAFEDELGEKVSWAQVDREVEGMCFEFWSWADAEGLDEAVARFPDVAAFLAGSRSQSADTRRRLREALNPPAEAEAEADTRSLEEQLDDARQDAEWAWESWSETRAEAANETALFGDSWAGSRDQVARLAARAREADEKAWRLADWLGRGWERGPARPYVDTGDEPF